ncbi:hypothetical protein SDC9_122125 [bioreactor metagenome]|uniref:Uncharacterized protein n=1 Tax=bioreactor metagenome TaxID=1076179 RepID=A0A645CDW4_9ZZZZ
MTKIRRRTADIVNIALESGVLRKRSRFLQNGAMRTPGHDAPLVERQRAEVAVSEATARGGNGERDLVQRRHPSSEGRMRPSREWQCIYLVQFRR